MKKLIILTLFFMLILPNVVEAEPTEVPSAETAAASEDLEKNNDKQAAGIQQMIINWKNMNEMQIALVLINRQIEYLMGEIEKNADRNAKVIEDYEKRFSEERQRLQGEISDLKQELDKKNEQLETIRAENLELNKRVALYNSENGVYLKIVIGFIAGMVLGVMVNSLLGYLNKRRQIQ